MLRKTLRALVLIPLAIVFVAFAVANRHLVTVSFDPFNSADPALGLSLPLFVVIILTAMFGVVAGGVATWVAQRRWRKAARRFESEAADARRQLADVEARARLAIRPENAVPVPAPRPLYPAIARDKYGATL